MFLSSIHDQKLKSIINWYGRVFRIIKKAQHYSLLSLYDIIPFSLYDKILPVDVVTIAKVCDLASLYTIVQLIFHDTEEKPI